MPAAVHFYHLWLGAAWQQIAREHFVALREAQFTGEVRVGLVGSAEARASARSWLGEYGKQRYVVAEADTGFEELTLRALHRAVTALPGSTPVLYAHTKGAFHPSKANTQWRKEMTAYLVSAWRDRVVELSSHDISAWHWLSPGEYVSTGQVFRVQKPMAAGNFWWARADYLRGLPEPPEKLAEADRMDAETWVGQDCPHIAYLSGQWPTVTVERTLQQVVVNGIAQNQWVAVD